MANRLPRFPSLFVTTSQSFRAEIQVDMLHKFFQLLLLVADNRPYKYFKLVFIAFEYKNFCAGSFQFLQTSSYCANRVLFKLVVYPLVSKFSKMMFKISVGKLPQDFIL